MSNLQDQLLNFTVEFNAVLMDSEMPPLERISKLLHLQQGFDILPNESSRVIFKLQSNLVLGDCYVQTHQRYKLTPIVQECKQLLVKLEEHDFATQPKEVWDYLAERFEAYYGELIALCQAKNHQRDVAHCHQQVARIWDKVGNQQNCIKAFVLSNIALAKVSATFALSEYQLIEQFPQHAQLIGKTFQSAHSLKNDPIEQTQQYLDIYDEAEQIIQGLIDQEGRQASSPDQYWRIKGEVLQFHFGISWKSPRVLNPQAKF